MRNPFPEGDKITPDELHRLLAESFRILKALIELLEPTGKSEANSSRSLTFWRKFLEREASREVSAKSKVKSWENGASTYERSIRGEIDNEISALSPRLVPMHSKGILALENACTKIYESAGEIDEQQQKALDTTLQAIEEFTILARKKNRLPNVALKLNRSLIRTISDLKQAHDFVVCQKAEHLVLLQGKQLSLLLDRQQRNKGWGKEIRQDINPNSLNTAEVLKALIAWKLADQDVAVSEVKENTIDKGIEFLLQERSDDFTWPSIGPESSEACLLRTSYANHILFMEQPNLLSSEQIDSMINLADQPITNIESLYSHVALAKCLGSLNTDKDRDFTSHIETLCSSILSSCQSLMSNDRTRDRGLARFVAGLGLIAATIVDRCSAEDFMPVRTRLAGQVIKSPDLDLPEADVKYNEQKKDFTYWREIWCLQALAMQPFVSRLQIIDYLHTIKEKNNIEGLGVTPHPKQAIQIWATAHLLETLAVFRDSIQN